MTSSPAAHVKWPTLAALPILAFATYFEWYWVWGLLFIYWGISSTLAGEAFVVEPLYRGRNPVLFWLVSVVWVIFGLWYVVSDLPMRI